MKYVSATDSLRPGQLNRLISTIKDGTPLSEIPIKKEKAIMQDVACAMVKAYNETKNKKAACRKVEKDYPDINKNIIHSMWAAIDAYVDLNI